MQSGGGTGGFSRVLRLLEAAAAGPGPFDAALAQAEQVQVQRNAELDAAGVQLTAAEAVVGVARNELTLTQQELRRIDDRLAAPAATSTTTTAPAPVSRTAGGPPTGTTTVAARPTVNVAPAPDPAVARRLVLGARVPQQEQALRDAEGSVLAARQARDAAVAAAAGAAQAVEALRQQLWSKMSDPSFRTAARVLVAGTGPNPQVAPSTLAASDVPAPWLALYQKGAATCPGLSWTILAAIGSIESNHGRSTLPGVHSGANFAGARGPMQFLAGTWSAYGVDGDGDGDRDVYDPSDAVHGAARYLCANGAGGMPRLADAIWAYNHAGWYVDDVLALALRYGSDGLSAEPAAAVADSAALLSSPNVILTAQARLDLSTGVVDPRVVRSLAAAAATGHRIAVSVLQTGHSMFVAGTDRVSNHYYGRGVDIYAVDGADVSASNDAALELALAILTTAPELRPDEFGSPWPELGPFPGAFSDSDHTDHLHLGWGPRAPEAH